MAGEPSRVEVHVDVDRAMSWWRPLVNAVVGLVHTGVAGVLAAASLVVVVVIGAVVVVLGRAPEPLVRFQVMTVRARVRAYSYWFVLRESHPPFTFALRLDDPGDDPATRVSVADVPRRLARTALLVHTVRVLPHLLVLVPIAAVMDVCYPVWILLAAANRGWPEPLARFLVAIERWVVHLALYALLVTDDPPAFGLAANGYVAVGRAEPAT